MFILFGYIKPFKPQLRMCEYDIYKAIYCGLCKELGKKYNFLLRFTLSYDFTFLALMDFAVNDLEISISNQACIAHPMKKMPCINIGNLSLTSAAAVISIYHKINDDFNDNKYFKKILYAILLMLFKSSYKKACKQLPQLSNVMEKYLAMQNKLEKEHNNSIDMAAEPTAQIMSEITMLLSDDINTKRILKRMGYLLGRYVYLIDAFDDVKKDYKTNSYNPFLLQDNCKGCNMENIIQIARYSINFTLGELADSFNLLNLKKFKPILDNIIYLGLKTTVDSVFYKKELKND